MPLQLPYLHLLHKLGGACPASQIILLELPAVSLRLNQRAPDVDAIAHAAVAAAAQHARLPACFVGHSFGTFCVSRVVQLHPAAVHSVVRLAWRHLQGSRRAAPAQQASSPGWHSHSAKLAISGNL